MPGASGTYPVNIGGFSGGVFIPPVYQGENVVIIEAPTNPFTFAKPECSRVTFNDAPAFDTMTFSCLVTNNTDMTLTRILMQRWYYCDYAGCIGECTICHQVRTKTLDPGQSYIFSFNGNSRDPVTGAYCGPLISLRQTHYMFLRDENGYESERCSVYRS